MNIEELQAQLQERIAKLDEERKANAERFAKEREQLLLDAEIERKERLDAYQAKVAAHEERRKAEEAEKEAQRIREVAARTAAEQKQNALDETLRLQREKLEWLETAISNAEFVEEQHRKATENAQILTPQESESGEINVEHPIAPDNHGNAAVGTEGIQESALMSAHLRQILRQANKQ